MSARERNVFTSTSVRSGLCRSTACGPATGTELAPQLQAEKQNRSKRNYFIYGTNPKKKQVEAREKLIAEGKPLGTHEAKEIRCVGLLGRSGLYRYALSPAGARAGA